MFTTNNMISTNHSPYVTMCGAAGLPSVKEQHKETQGTHLDDWQ